MTRTTGPTGSADRSLLVIGGGIAGLSMGCYAQMNGYRSTILEMHDKPGGLMTAWTRKGYTIDYCIHWLCGSKPGGSLYRLWGEIGLIQGLELVDLDEFYRYEGEDGRTVVIYRDLDRTMTGLCELSPVDAPAIREFFGAAKKLIGKDMMADVPPREIMGLGGTAKMLPRMLPILRPFRKWGPRSLASVAAQFRDPLLAAAFRAMWPTESSAFFMLMTLAWLHEGSAGYPIGGSMPMARSVERRFADLGGEMRYGARVAEILVEDGRAVGVRLEDGEELRAGAVVSAADGHATIYEMLGGRFLGSVHRDVYEGGVLPLFTSLLFIGVGVDDPFADLPQIATGIEMPMAAPLELGGRTYPRLHVRVHNFDRTLAPEGKTVTDVHPRGRRSVLGPPARRGPRALQGGEAARGRRRRRHAGPALAGHGRQGRDDRRQHAGNAGALHRQLARELRGLAAHAGVAAQGSAQDAARPGRASGWPGSGWRRAADCPPA